MAYFVIIGTAANRVSQYANFDDQAAANACAAQNPGSFVVDESTVPGPFSQWWIVGQVVTIVPVPPTAEQVMQQQIDGEFDAAKLDAWVVQFLAMTPSGAQDFVNSNSATLAALRTHVARLAYVVRVLVKREMRQ